MTPRHDIVAEADHHSGIAMGAALDCIAAARAEPILAPVMLGCAFGCAGVGLAIASVGIFVGLWRAAQAGAETEFASAP